MADHETEMMMEIEGARCELDRFAAKVRMGHTKQAHIAASNLMSHVNSACCRYNQCHNLTNERREEMLSIH